MTADFKIPDFGDYYMNIAFAVRRRANCTGYKVGAVLVVDNRVVSTGYNGVDSDHFAWRIGTWRDALSLCSPGGN
jgi:deoxycytidylate deaminase